MTNNTLLQAKSFEKQCERYEELTRPFNSDGTYTPFACLLDSDRALEICKVQAGLEQTVNLVNEREMKNFMNSGYIRRAINILHHIANR